MFVGKRVKSNEVSTFVNNSAEDNTNIDDKSANNVSEGVPKVI